MSGEVANPSILESHARQIHENVDNSLRRRNRVSTLDELVTEDVTLYLSAIQLYVAQKLGLIKELPRKKEKKILDKSKSDNFVKLAGLAEIIFFSGPYHQSARERIANIPARDDYARILYLLLSSLLLLLV